MSAADTQKREKEIEEALSSKIMNKVYDVLEKYGITGGGSRDFFWRQLAIEYACEIINGKMTEDEVLRDIGRANMILVNYVTEACQRKKEYLSKNTVNPVGHV